MRVVGLVVLSACGRFDFAARVADARIETVASVAACVEPAMPDPSVCTSTNGARELVVDQKDSTTNKPWYGFVRFDLDPSIASHPVATVTLRMVATDNAKAAGPSSGEVWAVSPFALADLSVATPTQQLGGPLASDQGAVAKLQVIEWPLPTSILAPSIFLGMFPTAADGVNYWNLAGPDPPRLIVDLE